MFQFQPITSDFVTKMIKQLKPNKAIGLDKISARLLKEAVEVVTPTITSLFNISLETEIYPSTWKLAKVTPLFKKGSRQDPSNYRPISVLPTISKILEKAIHAQFFTYLSDNQLLSSKQFGFKLNASAVTATAMSTDKILSAMDSGMVTGAVFIDLTKAFDTVNHSILLSKLKCLGVSADCYLLQLLPISGSNLASVIVVKSLSTRMSNQTRTYYQLEFHKVRYLDRCYLQLTLVTYQTI